MRFPCGPSWLSHTFEYSDGDVTAPKQRHAMPILDQSIQLPSICLQEGAAGQIGRRKLNLERTYSDPGSRSRLNGWPRQASLPADSSMTAQPNLGGVSNYCKYYRPGRVDT